MLALVTGCAGFIGHHLSRHLLDEGWEVAGLDNFDPYYDIRIKKSNLGKIQDHANFEFIEFDIVDCRNLEAALGQKPDMIVHLAAKAGVRASFEFPVDFARVNMNGTLEILDYTRRNEIKHVVFASSSSVYGETEIRPFKEDDKTISPISPYGMTKYHCENYCRLYTELYGLEINALRFFTVYGPGQRPDMAINQFIRNIMDEKEIPMFGSGEMYRDYTYIDDIVTGIVGSMNYFKGFNIFNLGCGNPVKLNEMIESISDLLNIKPKIRIVASPPGEMSGTYADISRARKLLDYEPITMFRDGVEKEIEWIKKHRRLFD